MAGAAAGGFVARALEAMLKECAGRKYPALQKAAQSCLDDMKEVKQGPLSDQSNNAAPSQGEKRVDSNGSANGGNESDPTTISEADAAPHSKETHKSITAALVTAGCILDEKQAELVLQPLRLAFETKNIKLVDLALDCLHKFIAYDHLEGDPGLENGKNASLFTEILNMVCSCVDNSSSDSTILQVLKVFLTAVSSTRFRVHGEPMLGVIRVCYNIALNSKSSINQVTSKAMLTQMISIVFRRMESDEVSTSVSSSEHSDPHVVSSSNTDNGEITIDDQDGKKLTLGDALAMSRENESSPASVEELQSLAGGADIKGLEAVLDKAVQLEDGKKISRGIDIESMNVGQHDALLLFRTLCKMGMKEEGDEVTTKTRLLSLELLQSLLEGVSQSFSKNFHFIDSVKAYLFMHYCEPLFLHLLLYFRCPSRSKVAIKSNIKMDASIIVKEGNTGSEICASGNLTKVVEANDNNEESSGTELSSDDTSSSSSSSEDEDDDDDGSDDNEKENDRIHKQNNGDEEVEEEEIRDAELEEMLVDSDGEDEVPKGPVKSKNEVVVLPPVAKVEVSLEPHHQLLPVGVISSILGNTVIVEGLEKHSPLNEGSILWITETRLPLGFIDEIFGPVKNPFYLIRYNSDMELPVGISTGTAVSVVMEFATHIINEKELCGKAYDASGDNDEDLSDEVEFSDDEKEAEYRKSLHREKRGCGTREQDSNDSFVGKKIHRKGAGSRKHSSTMRQALNLIDKQLPSPEKDKQLPYVTDFVQLPLAAVDFGGSRYSCSQLEISGVNPPASSLAVHQTTQTGSFGDLPQQLPQQPNAFWANGFQAQQQQNLAIQGLMTNIMMGMQLGDPTFSQQHANQLGNFPSGMPLQQQLTPNFQYTAPTPWLGGLMNPAFTVMPMGSIFGGNVGQMTFDGSNVQEQVAPAFPQGQNFVQPPRATAPTGRRPPMQFNRGRSSFHGKTPHHRGGRHSHGRGSQM